MARLLDGNPTWTFTCAHTPASVPTSACSATSVSRRRAGIVFQNTSVDVGNFLDKYRPLNALRLEGMPNAETEHAALRGGMHAKDRLHSGQKHPRISPM